VKLKELILVRKVLHEVEMLQKREKATQAKAAEEHGDKAEKWPRVNSGPLDLCILILVVV
jgi:Ca2+/H+ antiporter